MCGCVCVCVYVCVCVWCGCANHVTASRERHKTCLVVTQKKIRIFLTWLYYKNVTLKIQSFAYLYMGTMLVILIYVAYYIELYSVVSNTKRHFKA